jgi:hypothetical protein
MARSELPTPEFLRQILDYNPDTGSFTWKERTPEMFTCARGQGWACNAWNAKNAGKPASSTHTNGYYQIGINGRSFLAHRVAWAYMTGRWPSRMIDHEDTDRMNNSWSNLREATNSQNKANAPCHADSASGVKGVMWFKQTNRWHVQIQANGKKHHIGFFTDIEAAKQAYNDAATRLHGEFARLN